jgi:hypothetical protein
MGRPNYATLSQAFIQIYHLIIIFRFFTLFLYFPFKFKIRFKFFKAVITIKEEKVLEYLKKRPLIRLPLAW